MSKSWAKQRREEYAKFGDANFREAVYEFFKAQEAAGVPLPAASQSYVAHVDDVKARVPKPAKPKK